MSAVHVILAFIIGAIAGYAFRAKIGDEMTKLSADVKALLAEAKAKV